MFKRLLKKMSTTPADYEKWLKTQLIRRIRELESRGLAVAPVPKKRQFDFTKIHTRFIALRFAYMGWNYNGLAYQYEPTPLPTVEEEILAAMEKAKLVSAADPGVCDFSRCGRTDKGVSALNQVISLRVRSTVEPEKQSDASFDAQEIPYLTILNALLPPDIRMTAVCLRPPPNFDARFSCSYRHYKYLFSSKGLDVGLMAQAAQLYEGVHDFRNFCKIDGLKQITNHFREVFLAKIERVNDDFYVFDLKGLAFLWHQVRCMIAILFLVGQGLESPSVITELLDIGRYPRKPVFEMANDIPLVLYDCVFPEMEWLNSADHFDGTQVQKLFREQGRFGALLFDHKLKAQIASMVSLVFMREIDPQRVPNSGYVHTGDGMGRNFKTYVPILGREVGDDVEAVNARHREKKKRKLLEKSQTTSEMTSGPEAAAKTENMETDA